MVRLFRIYTKGGDKGKTSLGDGTRVKKTEGRIGVIGSIDEVNASIGVCRSTLVHASLPKEAQGDIDLFLRCCQNDLFDIGADLCLPKGEGLRLTSDQVTFLEKTIDEWNTSLAPLTSFILPGGCLFSAHVHMARTIVRRTERLLWQFDEELKNPPHHDIDEKEESPSLNPIIRMYINRLSDALFVLGRVGNAYGNEDILWEPGKGRVQK